MAPATVKEVAETNSPPQVDSGLLKHDDAASQWMPETVLGTITETCRPKPGSTTPVQFFHLLERLKTTKREGWRRFGIVHGESIADHMYRMSIITMMAPKSLSSRLDIPKCTKMALIHDMAESLVGDITPVDGVLKPEKSRREATTMDYICTGLLGGFDGGVQGQEMRDIWQEYEDGQTFESQFVHDVDKVELILQMLEYERSQEGQVDLGEFSWVARKIVLPEVQEWCSSLLAEREVLWQKLQKKPLGPTMSERRETQQEEYYSTQTAKATDGSK